MDVDWAAVIAIVGAVAGLGSAYAAWRKIRPESTKLELEGRSTFIAAESGYFDRLTERLELENLRLSGEMTALRERVVLLESVEQRLVSMQSERDDAVRSVAAEKVKVDQLEQRVSALEAELVVLKDKPAR